MSLADGFKAATQTALVNGALWGLERALSFARTDEARALVERLMSAEIPGEDKRREVRAVFFQGLGGAKKYLADALITLLAAQVVARLGAE